MKRLITFIGVSFLFAQLAGAALMQPMLARVTVYWAGEGSGQRAASNGARLHNGNCAVDPHKIPFGSQVIFDDASCVAVDTGSAVISRKAARECGRNVREQNALVIDRYFESKTEAMSWVANHRQFVNVWVVSPGSKTAKNRNRVALELNLTKSPSEQFTLSSRRKDG
jgi:3D (Asp-Asp-Asp) domain-containing protein